MRRPGGLSTSARKTYRQVRFELPEGATEIVLVRHGETIPAVAGVPFPLAAGHGDPELRPEGHEQAELVAGRLAGERIDALYVTSLRRTLETAAPLADRLGIEPIVEPRLREVFLGEWEGGLYRQHVVDGHPLVAEMLLRQRWDVIPGAETNEALRDRLVTAIEHIAASHVGGRVVAFSHGGAIATLLSLASGARPFAFLGVDNGSISRLVVTKEHWLVRSFNDTSHLAVSLLGSPSRDGTDPTPA